MKLIMAIINDDDSVKVVELLNEKGFGVTKLATTGGFLRSGNTTIMTCVDDKKVETVIDIIETKCKSRKTVTPMNPSHMNADYVSFPIEVSVGGATVFVLDVAEFKKF